MCHSVFLAVIRSFTAPVVSLQLDTVGVLPSLFLGYLLVDDVVPELLSWKCHQ